MMTTLRTGIFGAVAVLGQVPDLREGDCVRALDDIDYEHMPKVQKGDRGMVTGKGILWEDRDWLFTSSAASQKDLLAQRNAIIHRSMVEKIPESEGYGVIRLDEGTCYRDNPDGPGKFPVACSEFGKSQASSVNEAGQCWTVFELDALNDGKTPQSAKVQLWDCVPGWTDQIFIYPACGVGPGQIRWAKDPQLCVYRQITKERLVLSACEWTQPFIFTVEKDPANKDTKEDAKTSTARKQFKVGMNHYDPPSDRAAADDYDKGKHAGQYNKDTAPECFKVSEPKFATKTPATENNPNFGVSDKDAGSAMGCSQKFVLPGQWDSETV